MLSDRVLVLIKTFKNSTKMEGILPMVQTLPTFSSLSPIPTGVVPTVPTAAPSDLGLVYLYNSSLGCNSSLGPMYYDVMVGTQLLF